MQFAFVLAEHLHKSVAEIMELSESEILGWQAFFKLRKKQSGE